MEAAVDPRLLERQSAHEQVIELISEQRYEQSLEQAKEVVALTEEIYGADSFELAQPLSNLATVQSYTGDYVAARETSLRAIRIIETERGSLAPELQEPLTWLATSYLKAGQYEAGEKTLLRALNVSHANQGFYNINQLALRDSLSATYLALGDLEKAEFHQAAQVYIHEYRYGRRSAETVPAYFKLAKWYGSVNQPMNELTAYRAAFRILEKESGENNPELIDALRYIADSYVSQPGASGSEIYMLNRGTTNLSTDPDTIAAGQIRNGAVAALKRAIEIAEIQSEPDEMLIAELNLELGDVFTLFGSPRNGEQRYQNTWATYAAQGNSTELLEGAFGTPVPIGVLDIPTHYPNKRSTEIALASNPEDFGNGVIVAEFDVSASGAVKNINIIEAAPGSTLERQLKRELVYGRYRPAMKNGEAVKVSGVTYRHEFKYQYAAVKEEFEKEIEESFEPLPNPNLPAN